MIFKKTEYEVLDRKLYQYVKQKPIADNCKVKTLTEMVKRDLKK